MSEAGSRDELHSLAARLTTAHGAGMFPAMAQYLSAMLHADEVLIGEAIDEHHAQTLGACINGAAQPNYQFPLAGTPYEALIRADAEPQAEAAETAESNGGGGESGYFGMPLQDPAGTILGFVCARSPAALNITEHQHCLIEIVAVLLTTELQLLRTQRERGALDSQVHRLRAELDAAERLEITAAATGRHQALSPASPIDLDDTSATGLHHVQREHILRVLNATRWVIEGNSGAALKLGMKPATLRHRMKKLGIARASHQL
jgi:Bacterial regulatory protein, Fis family